MISNNCESERITRDTILVAGDVFFEATYEYNVINVEEGIVTYRARSRNGSWISSVYGNCRLENLRGSIFRKVIFERPYDPSQAGDTDDDI